MKATVLAAVTGVLLAASSASAAPRWLGQEEPFGDTSSGGSAVAMAPDGTVAVARYADTSSPRPVEVSVRPPGGDFGPAEQVDTTIDLTTPTLVAGGDGTIAVTYFATSKRWVSFRPPGGHFGQPRELDAPVGDPRQLGLDASGRLWFAYVTDGQPSVVKVGVMGPAGDVQTQTIDTMPAGAVASGASLAVGGSGDVDVAYATSVTDDPDGPTCTTASSIREASGGAGGFGAPTTLATATDTGAGSPICTPISGSTATNPQVVRGADGATTVGYMVQSVSGAGATIFARHRDPGGSWPAPDSPAETLVSGSALEPFLAAAGSTALAAIRDVVFPGRALLTVRNADGTWTSPKTVSGDTGAASVRVAGSPSGGAIVAWADLTAPYRVRAVTRAPDGSISDAKAISAGAAGAPALTDVGIDRQGNGVVKWADPVTGGNRLRTAGYDAAGPRLDSVTIPTAGAPGQPLGFAASAVDVWSAVGAVSWLFGDGAGSVGTTASHAYAAPGAPTVTLNAVDGFGNTTTVQRAVAISAPRPRDTTPPKLTNVKVTRRKATFTIDEPATVQTVLALKAKGLKKGKRCVKRRRHAHGRSCTRYVTKKTLHTTLAKAGAGSITLPKKLARGTYRVTLTATDAAGNRSQPTSRTLKVR